MPILPKSMTSSSSQSGGSPFIGRGAKFYNAVGNVPLKEDIAFSTVDNGYKSSAKVIANAVDLAKMFNPLEGEFEADGTWVGGTGLTTIGSEMERYRTSFDGNNHIFDADGLRLQVTCPNGTQNTYVVGSIVTASGNGITCNAPGGVATSAYADLGLTPALMANAAVGDIWVSGWGMFTLKAFDNTAQTATFEAVTGGVKTNYKGNWHVTGTKMAFAQIATEITNGVTTSVTFTAPVPAQVVPGCFALWANRGAYYYDPACADRARVASISADRLTVTFDSPINTNSSTVNVANKSGAIFIPEIWSGQIWSKKSYGPHRAGKNFQAIRVEFTMPTMPSYKGASAYSGTQMSTIINGNAGTLWGYWPAIWLYTHRPGGTDDVGVGRVTPAGYRLPWSELDMLEVFVRPWTGQNQMYMALHNQPYTRTRNSITGYATAQDALTGNVTQYVATVTAGVPIALNTPADNVTGATGYLIHPQVFLPTVSGTAVTLTIQTSIPQMDGTSKYNGIYWAPQATDAKMRSPNALSAVLPFPICDGTRHSMAIIWTKDKVIHYFDDIPMCESQWAVDTDYPHQLGLNVAVGSLTANNCGGLFFPHTNAQIAGMFMKVHSIRTWEA